MCVGGGGVNITWTCYSAALIMMMNEYVFSQGRRNNFDEIF